LPEIRACAFPRVAADGNPGLEAATALRLLVQTLPPTVLVVEDTLIKIKLVVFNAIKLVVFNAIKLVVFNAIKLVVFNAIKLVVFNAIPATHETNDQELPVSRYPVK
jgi:hypothetical protein